MNSSKYHYIAVIEPNALLEKFLLCLPLGIDFVQITSVIFKLMKNLNNIKLVIWNHNHIDLEIAEKFTTVLNKKTNKLKEKPGNTWKRLLRDKSLHLPIIAIYDFDTVIVYTDD